MLRTNLSTRPFYNERALHGVLGVAALIVVVADDLQRHADRPVDRAANRRSAARRRRGGDTRDRASGACGPNAAGGRTRSRSTPSRAPRSEANTIIGQRLFSWTDLLNRLGDALPDSVRITALRPDVERDGSVTVADDRVRRKRRRHRAVHGESRDSRRPSARSIRSATNRRKAAAYAPAWKGNMHLPLRRIFDDKRRLVIPVLAGLALNVVLFAGVVYPLRARMRQHRSPRRSRHAAAAGRRARRRRSTRSYRRARSYRRWR